MDHNQGLVPLSIMRSGQRGRIITLNVGRGQARRLMEMGLLPGEIVDILSNSAGPIIIRVRDVTLALGRNIASRIWIEAM